MGERTKASNALTLHNNIRQYMSYEIQLPAMALPIEKNR
jgi:hypothetical protein